MGRGGAARGPRSPVPKVVGVGELSIVAYRAGGAIYLNGTSRTGGLLQRPHLARRHQTIDVRSLEAGRGPVSDGQCGRSVPTSRTWPERHAHCLDQYCGRTCVWIVGHRISSVAITVRLARGSSAALAGCAVVTRLPSGQTGAGGYLSRPGAAESSGCVAVMSCQMA